MTIDDQQERKKEKDCLETTKRKTNKADAELLLNDNWW